MAPFDERDVPADPLTLFTAWQAEADARLPHAAALATADADGRPSIRMVLAILVDDGFRFFTNHGSRKARELDANPRAALAFWWDSRQVTVTGAVERVTAEASDAYWATRPRGSQLSAAASPQSQPVPSREALVEAVAELDRTHADRPVPRPDHWGGYTLIPDELVFWQHDPDRLHDRVRYHGAAGGWRVERLAP